MSVKWEAFEGEITRVQGHNVPVNMRVKSDRSSEHWMTRDIESLIKKKKEAYIRYRQLGSSDCLKENRGVGVYIRRNQDEVTKKIDEGRMVDVVYMDFSKTFNKVPHDRLVSK
eukprot:g33300.t1